MLATILVLGLVLGGCERSPAPAEVVRPVRAMRVAGPEEHMQRSFPGLASASTEVNLSFRVGGPLISRPVAVGYVVEAGQVVAQIDPRDFEVRLNVVQGQLERAKAAREYAQTEYDRVARILKEDPGAASQVALDTTKRELDVQKANVQSLEASVTAAEDQLGYTQLKAPFAGRVVATYVENFEDVLPKQPILRIIDRSRVEFNISVPESLIGYAPYVDEIVIRFDAFEGRTFPAKIKEIGEEATQATRTYPVTLVMGQPDDVEILAGMAGDAQIISRPPELEASGIAIPATAVFADSSSADTFVWVCNASTQTLERRKIDAKRFSNTGLRVQSGLSAGEWIVIAGVHSARDGQRVRILDDATGKEVKL
ncbi:MAG: efflux RND transporter periplasmic adaptor subunit [Phycisphaerales bacterium]|nr:MAG: efflux RND transporter periplasmic adaptor subunit [Phycisphaerales bacterium]